MENGTTNEVNNKTNALQFAKAYYSILFNTKLSMDTRCMLIYALDNKPTWKFTANYARKKMGASKKVMTRILKELTNAGYLTCRKVPTAKGRFNYDYTFYPTPIEVNTIGSFITNVSLSQKDTDTSIPDVIEPVAQKDTETSIPNVAVPVAQKDIETSIPNVTEPVAQTDPFNHTLFNQIKNNQTNSNQTNKNQTNQINPELPIKSETANVNPNSNPTLNEVIEHFIENGSTAECAEDWFNKMDNKNWLDAKGKSINK